jgi:hypothetical protein
LTLSRATLLEQSMKNNKPIYSVGFCRGCRQTGRLNPSTIDSLWPLCEECYFQEKYDLDILYLDWERGVESGEEWAMTSWPHGEEAEFKSFYPNEKNSPYEY